MKRTLLFFVLGLLFVTLSMAQESKCKPQTYSDRERTKLARFDENLKPDQSERDSLRIVYAEHLAKMSTMLDTLDIPEKRRQRLFKELEKNPFSEKLLKIVATLEVESYD